MNREGKAAARAESADAAPAEDGDAAEGAAEANVAPTGAEDEARLPTAASRQ